MLAAPSNKAGPFLPPCLAQSFPGSSSGFASQHSLGWVCKLSSKLWWSCLVLHFPRCPKDEDSWDWRDKLISHRFHRMGHWAFRQISPKTGSSINMEMLNEPSRHQQQMQVHRCLLITKAHSSWDLNRLLYAQRERERNWRKLAITQFYFLASPFAVHQVALHSHTKGACEH